MASNKATKVLDIGAGAGKFCMIGSASTSGNFTGVEYRKSLYDLAIEIKKKYKLRNSSFLNKNIVNIDFKKFEAFYFFNSFYENVAPFERVTTEKEPSDNLYYEYSSYVKQELERMPIGTRLATYHSGSSITPSSYTLINSEFEEKLKLWEKTS